MRTCIPTLVIGIGAYGYDVVLSLKQKLVQSAPDLLDGMRLLAIDWKGTSDTQTGRSSSVLDGVSF